MSAIVLYDGSCAVCSAAVRFILPRDPAGYFRFASQDSAVAEALLARHGVSAERGRTLVLVEDGRAHLRSEAMLRIARRLRGAAPLLTASRLLPVRWRDAAYDLVARHRRRLLGERRCLVVPPHLRTRFLDQDTP